MTSTVLDIPTSGPAEGLEIAKKRIRILAFLIDFILYGCIGMVLGHFFGESMDGQFGFQLTGIPAIVMMAIGLFLWPVSEGMWGQTLGKRLIKLEVVTEEYKTISMGQAFGRFFLGWVDYFFLIGLIIASRNNLNQRIGDKVTNTLVVHHRRD